jgi:hypothetical protein
MGYCTRFGEAHAVVSGDRYPISTLWTSFPQDTRSSGRTRAAGLAFLCTDLDANPFDVVRWFIRHLSIEVTFAEVRRHLGVETQRQWYERRSLAPHQSCL